MNSYTVYFKSGKLVFLNLGESLPEAKILGDLAPLEDGYLYFFPATPNDGGCWTAWILTAIADKLNQLNKAYDEKINKTLKTLKNKLKSKPIVLQQLITLRRKWLKCAKEYRVGQHWKCNDVNNKTIREGKAEAIEDCAAQLQEHIKNENKEKI